MEANAAIAAPSTIMPPADSYALVPPVVATSASDSQHQQRQPANKRKAEDADLDTAAAAAAVAAVPSPSPSAYPASKPLATVTGGLVTPPPQPQPQPPALAVAPVTITRQGSCAEMAIALDDSSSDDGEDMTDIPVDVGTTAASKAASATAATALAAAAAAAGAASRTTASSTAAAAAASGARLSIRLPSKALQNATGASANGSASGVGRASTSYAAQAAAASGGYGRHKHNQGLKRESGGGGSSGSGSSLPSLKRNKAGAAGGGDGGSGARQRGRPVGSKNRSSHADPPYVSTNPAQRAAAGSSGDDDGKPIASSRPRRRCEPRQRWADQMMNPGEQWARKVPKSARPLPTNPVEASIPDAPTFYPTEEQFRDPLTYIESIRPTAESYGIAKIVPPVGWKPPPTPLPPHASKLVPTKKQALHSLMNSDEVYDDGEDYTIVGYKMMADAVARKWRERDPPAQKPRAPPRYEPMGPNVEIRPGSTQAEIDAKVEENGRLRLLEREYWNVVDGGVEELEVEYANDLNISDFWSGFPMPEKDFMDGRAFDRTRPCNFDDPEYYRTCGWNLNNLPFWPGSVLRFFRTHINGLTAPWLYLGMQYATFAWHNEDNYLYSLNYHHSGAAKQWYGIPGKHAKGFEKCLAKILGETLETVSEHLYRITKMLSPVYLQEAGVPVCRLQQHPGQFVVTFPKAYHGGFSYGFNCGEAVNFAVPDWIAYSRESTEAYRSAQRMAALSHDKMVATLTMYLPDHDVKGCELVVRELRRIHQEELEHRVSLEQRGVQDPARQGVPLPRFRLGLIEQDTEEYDERRVCKTCKHTLFMTGVACPCSDVDVWCLRCVEEACDCPVDKKYLLSWWTEDDLSRFVRTAEDYLRKLANGQADEAAKASFRENINPF